MQGEGGGPETNSERVWCVQRKMAFTARETIQSQHYLISAVQFLPFVSWCGRAVRRLAGKQKDLGSIRLGSPFSSLQKLWFMDTVS